MTTESKREFDIIIFGATGFTGFYIIRELVSAIDLHPEQYSQLKWAVAGRNGQKLRAKLAQVGQELNHDLSKVGQVLADVSRPDTIREMAKRTRLVINSVGPYMLYGRPVVDACVEMGAHHVDISGEPNYIESMALDYHLKAADKRLVIVSSCGWDSIPADLGVDLAKRRFDGRLHSVETFVQIIPGAAGYRINDGTLKSLINGLKNKEQLKQIRKRLYSEIYRKNLPRSRIVLKRKTMPFTRPELDGWNLEFPGSDRSVIQRTQYHVYEHFNESPVQIQTYFNVGSFSHLIGLILVVAMMGLLIAIGSGAKLLEMYPEFFTAGIFGKKGPTREQIESARFRLLIFGKGWSRKIIGDQTDPDQEPEVEPDETITVKVSGPDPGYVATSACVVQAGLTILLESDRMPKGVLTPASAFRNTKLLERLDERDVKFEVLNQK